MKKYVPLPLIFKQFYINSFKLDTNAGFSYKPKYKTLLKLNYVSEK